MGAMTFYILKPCQGKAAFEAVLHSQIQIDITNRVKNLEAHGYEVLDAGIMLVAKKDEFEISIYPSAKLLIKCDSKEKATQKANEIYDILDISQLL
jgi:hypothetical protein